MRELRFDISFIHENADVSNIIKQFQNLCKNIPLKISNHAYGSQFKFNVSDEEYEENITYKQICPHCNGVISGIILEKSKGENI